MGLESNDLDIRGSESLGDVQTTNEAQAVAEAQAVNGAQAVSETQAAPLFPVAEKFSSINGEGAYAGRLAAFIRFAGCNLRCSYCDTEWAQDIALECEQISLGDLVKWVADQPVSCVTLTGGEPTLQPHLIELIGALFSLPHFVIPSAARDLCEARDLCAAKDPQDSSFTSFAQNDKKAQNDVALSHPEPAVQARDLPEESPPILDVIEIETNGSTDLAPLAAWRSNARAFERKKLHFTMDYKLPSSGMERLMRTDNFSLLNSDDVVKFVIGSPDDLQTMLRVVKEYALDERCRVYLSPVFGKIDPATIVDFMKENRLTKATLQLQLHKIIWPNEDRGV